MRTCAATNTMAGLCPMAARVYFGQTTKFPRPAGLRTDFTGQSGDAKWNRDPSMCVSAFRMPHTLLEFLKVAPPGVSLPLTEVLRSCCHPCDTPGKARCPMSASSAPRPLGREALLIPLMIAQCGDLTSFDIAHAPRITGVQCGTQRHTRRRARRRPYLL
jgi:hypothetical protein